MYQSTTLSDLSSQSHKHNMFSTGIYIMTNVPSRHYIIWLAIFNNVWIYDIDDNTYYHSVYSDRIMRGVYRSELRSRKGHWHRGVQNVYARGL
jgi:hypothetical protein